MTETSEPSQAAILSALTRIEARLDGLEQRMDRLEEGIVSVTREGRDMLALTTDTVDAYAARLAERGVDVDERMRAVLDAIEQLTEPKQLAALTEGLEMLRAAPAHLAMAGDAFDGLVGRLAAEGVDVDRRARVVWGVMERLTAPEALELVREFLAHVDAIRRLLESGIFAPGAVDMVDRAAGALASMDCGAVKPMGPFGALRAMRDPAIKHSLGVLVEFGRRFGAFCPGRNGTTDHNGTH